MYFLSSNLKKWDILDVSNFTKWKYVSVQSEQSESRGYLQSII